MEKDIKTRIGYLCSGNFGSSLIGTVKTTFDNIIFITQNKKDIPSVKELNKNNKTYYKVSTKEDLKLIIKRENITHLIVADFGMIIDEEIFKIVDNIINIHPSLLPKYRGPSPIVYPLLEGEYETGISIMKMIKRIDAGPIYIQEKIKIDDNDDEESLRKKLSLKSKELIEKFLPDILKNKIEARPQNDENASYTKLLKKNDGLINWHESAERVSSKIRAFRNWPGSYTFIEANNKRLRIKITEACYESGNNELPKTVIETKDKLKIKTGDGWLNIKKVQPENKRELTIEAFLAGYKNIKVDS